MPANASETAPRPRRQNRRGRSRPQPDTTIPSPCQAICRFDGEPFCLGCQRTADEIREWMIMTRAEKLAVLSRIDARRQTATEQIW